MAYIDLVLAVLVFKYDTVTLKLGQRALLCLIIVSYKQSPSVHVK